VVQQLRFHIMPEGMVRREIGIFDDPIHPAVDFPRASARPRIEARIGEPCLVCT
jgi:hypothetical protein